MITVNKIVNDMRSYGISIRGNDGEEELHILGSGGQDGSIATVIVAMEVDGGAKILLNERVKDEMFLDRVRDVITRWINGGDKVEYIMGFVKAHWPASAHTL